MELSGDVRAAILRVLEEYNPNGRVSENASDQATTVRPLITGASTGDIYGSDGRRQDDAAGGQNGPLSV